jgi:hypothetical protein
MNNEIREFAAEHGLPVDALNHAAHHIMDVMWDEMMKAESIDELVELMRAGFESHQKAVKSMANAAMTSDKTAKAVYSILKNR